MFKHVINSSHSYKSEHNIFFRYKKQNRPFIGFILNKKFGNAVERNRFKNQARSLFRIKYKDLSCGIIVRPLKPRVTFAEINDSLDSLKTKLTTK